MRNPKFDLKTKVTYNYKKIINEKVNVSENIPFISTNNNKKEKQGKHRENMPKMSFIEKQDNLKISPNVNPSTDLITPFKIKLNKRNENLNNLKSNLNNLFSDNEINNDEECSNLMILKSKTKENVLNSNTNKIMNIKKSPLIKNNKSIKFPTNLKNESDFSNSFEINSYTEKNCFENDGVNLIVNNEIALKNLCLIENWIEIENGLDNKHVINLISKRFLIFFKGEINESEYSSEIFSSPLLNKTYSKLIKFVIISLIYMRYIVSDFSYDLGIKNSLKKLVFSISESLVNIGESFILQKMEKSNDVKKNIMDKFQKSCKSHKINKNVKTNELIYIINKNNDIINSLIIAFSNDYFKTLYFKPIHRVCSQLLFGINNFNVKSLSILVVENILFSTIKNSQVEEDKILKDMSSQKLLPSINLVPIPYLPKLDNPNKMTLVLDLDETLAHYFHVRHKDKIETPLGGNFVIRPGVFEFLSSLSNNYEIVIFTASMKNYADTILNYIDKNNYYIKHRLYRHHCTTTTHSTYKDLSKLGRDLNKVIIVDNCSDNFKAHVLNGLEIKTWEDDIFDTHLNDLQRLLIEIENLKPNDIRPVIKYIKEEYAKNIKKKEYNPYSLIDISSFKMKN